MKKEIMYFVIGFILIIIDQITKLLFTDKVYHLSDFFYIQFSKNTGSSFSMFSTVPNYNIIMVFLSILILIILFWHYKQHFSKNRYLIASFILFLAGIYGNFLDRLIFGYVRDFMAVNSLFIFNIADLYLSAGLILFMISEFEIYKKKGHK